jgi:hypothetical protein
VAFVALKYSRTPRGQQKVSRKIPPAQAEVEDGIGRETSPMMIVET